MGILGSVKRLNLLLNHPLTEEHKLSALWRYLGWQAAIRLVRQPILFDFVNNSMLCIRKGEASSLVVHTGLFEYEEMCFVLHCLRKDDIFVDVGANVGVYTILASAVIGSRCVAFEPVPDTFTDLLLNIRLNNVGHLVRAVDAAIGSTNGAAACTAILGAANRITTGVAPGEVGTVQVRMARLDDAIQNLKPRILKIDVEGFETEVVSGGQETLSDPNLTAVIMELKGHGERYGFDEGMLHRKMLGFGFGSCLYEPKKREVIPTSSPRCSASGNVLYVRNADRATQLAKNAPQFFVRRICTWV